MEENTATQEKKSKTEMVYAAAEIQTSDEEEYVPPRGSRVCRVNFMPVGEALGTVPAPRQHAFLNCPKQPQPMPEKSTNPTAPGAKTLQCPIVCPGDGCGVTTVGSEFLRHWIKAHSSVPIKRIQLHKCKNFVLDPRLALRNASKCGAFFLLHKPDVQVGSDEYINDLPVMVMMTLVGLKDLKTGKQAEAEFEDVSVESSAESSVESSEESSVDCYTFLAIWVVGIDPPELPLSVTLSVWKRAAKMPILNQTLSAPVHDIHEGYWDIYGKGGSLLLSDEQVRVLTDGGTHSIEAQIEVH